MGGSAGWVADSWISAQVLISGLEAQPPHWASMMDMEPTEPKKEKKKEEMADIFIITNRPDSLEKTVITWTSYEETAVFPITDTVY